MDKERIKVMRIAASNEVDECLDEIERLRLGLVAQVDIRRVLTEKRDSPKLIVRMQVGEDPKSFDADTGEELKNRVKAITILPMRKAVATVKKLNKVGKKFVEDGEIACFEADVVRIVGVWETG